MKSSLWSWPYSLKGQLLGPIIGLEPQVLGPDLSLDGLVLGIKPRVLGPVLGLKSQVLGPVFSLEGEVVGPVLGLVSLLTSLDITMLRRGALMTVLLTLAMTSHLTSSARHVIDDVITHRVPGSHGERRLSLRKVHTARADATRLDKTVAFRRVGPCELSITDLRSRFNFKVKLLK